MVRHGIALSFVGSACLWLAGCSAFNSPVTVVTTPEPGPLETLAAREIQRYLYLRTGTLASIVETDQPAGKGDAILIGSVDSPLVQSALPDSDGLAAEQYHLKTIDAPGRRTVVVAGGDAVGTLYGAYRLAEHLGVRFFLHGDVVPDQRMACELPDLDERGKPLFELRGIQPFHDFPEGPDWWSLDGYKAIISQLPKLRMNFIGFHTYPEGGVGPEPMVWIGPPADVNPDGTVGHSYPARHFSTVNGTWGYKADVGQTGGYHCGADMLFERDVYCQDVQEGLCPWPATPEQCNTLFNKFGKQLAKAFAHARALGIKTCVGTEVPLKVPQAMLDHLKLDPGPVQPEGGLIVSNGDEIDKTDEDTVYQSMREGLKGYRLLVPNGQYKVTLRFAELGKLEAGQRVMDVTVQGRKVAQNFDVVARTGKKTAFAIVVNRVDVSDGILVVGLAASQGKPIISAIEVAGSNFTRKVNCGGCTYQDYVGDMDWPMTPEMWQRIYEGMFQRITRTHPLDYYWFWTPERWTWSNVARDEVDFAVENIKHARAAAKKVNAPFKLATCGWVLGPQYDRALFDKVLPRELPVSCINRKVGQDPVEPGFADVKGRDKWAIPWLEDDPALIVPQLWAGRMRKDAVDALDYGCTGLMGIHWRTRVLGPNISALAQAAWDQGSFRTAKPVGKDGRFLPADDFWRDWAVHLFGQGGGEKIGALFARIDGQLPRPSTWVSGPGGIKPDPRPWIEVAREYDFVDELEALRPLVTEPGSRERFDYWLNQFRYLRTTARINCAWALYNKTMEVVQADPDPVSRATKAAELALPLRRELVAAVAEAYRLLLASVTTTGQLGTLTNWEQHLLPGLLHEPGKALEKALGKPLEADALLSTAYAGAARLFVPEVRTTLSAGEPLSLRVLVLADAQPEHVALKWRPLGRGAYHTVQARHVARGVWTVSIPGDDAGRGSFEYYVESLTPTGDPLHWPATAPALNQTVVVSPAG